MSRRGVVVSVVASAVWAVAATPARAQTGLGGYELAVGVVGIGRMPIEDTSASLMRPTGQPFQVFHSQVSLGAGPGAEVHFGRPIGARLAVEATGTWTFISLRTDVSSDVEGAADATLSEDLSRLSVEGSLLWRLAGNDRRSFHVRGGAGWMRELAAGATLAEAGIIGNVGVAVKYWWGAASSIPHRRWGVRLDGGAVLRSGGVDLGAGGVHVAPAVSADLLVGF